MEDNFLNEGLDFLSRGKNSGRVFSFKDFLKEEEMLGTAADSDTVAASDAPTAEPVKDTQKKVGVGYGDQPFFFAKNGDAGLYFFKADDRGFVLNIGKFSKFSQPTENKVNYGVLSLTELPMADLDQAVLDNGKFDPNDNQISLSQSQITKILAQVAICVSDYVQKNPSTTKFYDEIQGNVTFPDYDNKFALAMTKWPGGTDSWKLQVVEQGKLNTVQK